jgi:hypothetical protein
MVNTIGTPYITLADLKGYLKIGLDKVGQDVQLQDAINSASNEINDHCGRQFGKADSLSARHYQPESQWSLMVDDFYDATGLTIAIETRYGVYSDPINPLPTDLRPLDGVMDGQPGWPYSEIRGNFGGYGGSIIRVTALWGWAAVPATIKQATLIVAAQTFRLSDTPLGIAGAENKFGGVVHVKDLPQVESKLARYVVDPLMIG